MSEAWVIQRKEGAIFDHHRSNADLLVCQETHSDPSCETVWTNEWGGKVIFAHGNTKSRGVAVFISKHVSLNIHNIHKDINGRYIIFDIYEEEHYVTILVLYAPNDDSPAFFQGIASHLSGRCENKIIIGDFNLTLNVELDRLNTYCNNNKARDEVLEIMDEFCLRDTWRDRNEEKREYSWIKKSVRNQERKASRIDMALFSAGLDQKIEMIQYLSSIMTDHRAIYVVVELIPNTRGVGYWKMNTQLLQQKRIYRCH